MGYQRGADVVRLVKDDNGIQRGWNDDYGSFTNPEELSCWAERKAKPC